MTRPDFPLTLRVAGRRVVVVGGGHLAARRTKTFLDADAEITVVAPEVTHDLRDLVEAGRISWAERPFRISDVDGAWLVQIATDAPAVDAEVAEACEARATWYFKGGDPESSPAWMPAVARTDDVIIAVNAGRDPRRAAHLRDSVQTQLETGNLPLHVARERPRGKVSLVGGGPGSSDLLTAHGRRLLADADVVVVDRLAPHDVLAELSTDIEVIDVGKRPDHHPIPQEQINRMLIEHARAGRHVVRLKGGDPYVFGRGGEERQACEAAGVAVEVVPGVTSSIAVPAAAGIPVTHRGLSRGFTVLTAHENLGALPYRDDHTLVLLMGVKTLLAACERLLLQRWPSELPVALVESGWRDGQRVTTGTLGSIGDLARRVGVEPPAVAILGRVVTLSPDWRPHE